MASREATSPCQWKKKKIIAKIILSKFQKVFLDKYNSVFLTLSALAGFSVSMCYQASE